MEEISTMELQLTNLSGGFLFLFEGTERTNATKSVIQNG